MYFYPEISLFFGEFPFLFLFVELYILLFLPNMELNIGMDHIMITYTEFENHTSVSNNIEFLQNLNTYLL